MIVRPVIPVPAGTQVSLTLGGEMHRGTILHYDRFYFVILDKPYRGHIGWYVGENALLLSLTPLDMFDLPDTTDVVI